LFQSAKIHILSHTAKRSVVFIQKKHADGEERNCLHPLLRRRFLATDYHGLTRFFIPWFAEQRSATELPPGGRKKSVSVRRLPRRGNSESVRGRPWPTKLLLPLTITD